MLKNQNRIWGPLALVAAFLFFSAGNGWAKPKDKNAAANDSDDTAAVSSDWVTGIGKIMDGTTKGDHLQKYITDGADPIGLIFAWTGVRKTVLNDGDFLAACKAKKGASCTKTVYEANVTIDPSSDLKPIITKVEFVRGNYVGVSTLMNGDNTLAKYEISGTSIFGHQSCDLTANGNKGKCVYLGGADPNASKTDLTKCEETLRAKGVRIDDRVRQACAQVYKRNEQFKNANTYLDQAGVTILAAKSAQLQTQQAAADAAGTSNIADSTRVAATQAGYAAAGQHAKTILSAWQLYRSAKGIADVKTAMKKIEGEMKLVNLGSATGHEDLAKLQKAWNENNEALKAAQASKNQSMAQFASTAGTAMTTQMIANQARAQANGINPGPQVPGPASTTPAPVPSYQAATNISIDNGNTSTLDKQAKTATDPGNKDTSTLNSGLGNGDYNADTPPTDLAKKDEKPAAGGAPASPGGGSMGGGGGAAPGGGHPDEAASTSPTFAGSFGGNDKYEAGGGKAARGGGGGGGSGGSAAAAKDDGFNMGDILAKLTGGDKVAPTDVANQGITAYADAAGRNPASADGEESLLGRDVDIFKRITKSLAYKALKGDVASE